MTLMMIAVKKADLIHNSNTWQIVTLDEKAKARIEKYRDALEILSSLEDEQL